MILFLYWQTAAFRATFIKVQAISIKAALSVVQLHHSWLVGYSWITVKMFFLPRVEYMSAESQGHVWGGCQDPDAGLCSQWWQIGWPEILPEGQMCKKSQHDLVWIIQFFYKPVVIFDPWSGHHGSSDAVQQGGGGHNKGFWELEFQSESQSDPLVLQLDLEVNWQLNLSCVLECPVNCQLSEWSDWSTCSQTCGLKGKRDITVWLHGWTLKLSRTDREVTG